MRTRVKAGLRLLGSSIQAWPRAIRYSRSRARDTFSNGRNSRAVPRSTTLAMPARPSTPLPLAARIAIVST